MTLELTRRSDSISTDGVACDPATRITRSLLGYGAVAGPFYLIVALAQAMFRPGFDILHDDVSLLSNGDLGWIQVANFLITGAMVIACAIGLRRALQRGPGSIGGPVLVGVFGLGLIGAGIFVADPMNGFPPGAAPGRSADITTSGLLHILTASIAFLCLITACMVFARRFATEHRRVRMWFSILTGVAFLAAFVGVASGSASVVVVLAFWAALIVVWSWLATLSIGAYRELAPGN